MRFVYVSEPEHLLILARGLQHNLSNPAQRRDDVAADVSIAARKHRRDASTRRQSYSPTAALYGH